MQVELLCHFIFKCHCNKFLWPISTKKCYRLIFQTSSMLTVLGKMLFLQKCIFRFYHDSMVYMFVLSGHSFFFFKGFLSETQFLMHVTNYASLCKDWCLSILLSVWKSFNLKVFLIFFLGSFKSFIMIVSIKLYQLISVWMTLTCFQGHSDVIKVSMRF